MASVTSLEHTGIGALSGALEVCIMQPTVGIKNALQEGRPLPRTLPALYRGLTINAVSMAPITAVQFGANRAFEQLVHSATGEEVSQGGRVALAAAAGACSSLIGSPAELLMVQQQSKGGALLGTAKQLFESRGALVLYRGLSMTMLRDSLYTAGYLGICPVLNDWLQKQPWMQQYHGSTPLLLSGITGGLFAAIASQPADTAKTRMQAFVDPAERPEYRTASSTVRTILREGGMKTLFAGLLPRGVRIVGAAFILNGSRNKAIEVVTHHRTGSPTI